MCREAIRLSEGLQRIVQLLPSSTSYAPSSQHRQHDGHQHQHQHHGIGFSALAALEPIAFDGTSLSLSLSLSLFILFVSLYL